MKTRMLKLSDKSFHQKNLFRLYNIFVNNGYPAKLVKNIVYNSSVVGFNNSEHLIVSTFNRPTVESINEPDDHMVQRYRRFPFINELIPKISRLFKKIPIKIAPIQ